MNEQNYTTSFIVKQSPEEVFKAVSNPRGWWSRVIEGKTDELNSVFYYHYKDMHHATFKIIEYIPNKKVVWRDLHNEFNFVQDHSEWTGTDIVFDILDKGHETELKFTHVGLVPSYECYGVCSDAWGTYIRGSLRNYISTGKGNPNPVEEIVDRATKMIEKA